MNISQIKTRMFLFPMWVYEMEDLSGTRQARSFYDHLSSSRRRAGLITTTEKMSDMSYVVSLTNETKFHIEDDHLFKVGCLAIKASFARRYPRGRVNLNVALVKHFR